MPENSADNDNHAPAPQDTSDSSQRDNLRARLAAFDRDLQAQEAASKPDRIDLAADYSKGYARASRIALELVVAILTGCALGYGLDKLAHTMPLFILLGSLLGFCAGVLNAWRALNGTYGQVGLGKIADARKEQDR